MREAIIERLAAIEREHGVGIVYACESGSRAWGFPSPDSDYDVRFVYAHDLDWYLSFDVERQRDVIECPIVDDLDCNGWDIRKAFHLFTRTNGALLEWLHSPIGYVERGDFAQSLRRLAPRCFDATALCYHYHHMAKSNARGYLFTEEVRLKKYFYVLRPLLAILHIERGFGIPPVRFDLLVHAVAPSSIRPSIAELLERKRKTSELGTGKPIPEIDRFVRTELERHGDAFSGRDRPDRLDKGELCHRLNEIFRSVVQTRPISEPGQ